MADTHDTRQLDLDAYLARTEWSGERRADLATLRSLHRAHMYGIPFENLQPLLGSAPSLDLTDLQHKLVGSPRGGYCYEHNTLFAAVLSVFGFGVTGLSARVRVGADPGQPRPRTHMLLLVDVPGEDGPYIADVGFGAGGALVEPAPLVTDTEFTGGNRRHRYMHEPHNGPLELWVFQTHEDGVWKDQYAFTLEPCEAPDFEVFNWHVGANPRSPFTRMLYAQRSSEDRRLILRRRILVEAHADGTRTKRELSDGAEVLRVLAEDFGIVLPEDIRLPDSAL
ncbi:arylamine N-acetyltransferase family protein [Streptomyces sannanensis]